MVLSKPIINSSVHSVHELLRKEGWLGREGGSWKGLHLSRWLYVDLGKEIREVSVGRRCRGVW